MSVLRRKELCDAEDRSPATPPEVRAGNQVKQVSAKRRRKMRDVKSVRDEYHARPCDVCQERSDDVHEIARGCHRDGALGERCALLSTCRGCHRELQDWPLPEQYALKALRDGENYDRVRLNELRGRGPDAINEVEVIQAAVLVLPKIRRT